MKHAILPLVSLLLLAILGGCSHTPIPLASSYPATTQHRMQAAHHWQVLAEHVAGRVFERLPNRINNQGRTLGMPPVVETPVPVYEPLPAPLPLEAAPIESQNYEPLSAPLPLEPQPMRPLQQLATPSPTPYAQEPALYINPPKRNNETPFGYAFYHLLRGELVNKNLIVTNRPDRVGSNCPGIDACTPMVLDYDIQVIHHKDRDSDIAMPGRWSIGAATLWLIAQAADKWNPPGWAVMPLAVAMDVNDWRKLRFPGQTNTEVVITTTITDGDLVVFSESNIYYINTGDDDHYEQHQKTFRVVAQ